MCRSGVIPEHWPSGGLRYPGRVIAREGGLDQPGTGPTFPSGLPGGGCSLDNAKRPRHPLYDASGTNTLPAHVGQSALRSPEVFGQTDKERDFAGRDDAGGCVHESLWAAFLGEQDRHRERDRSV